MVILATVSIFAAVAAVTSFATVSTFAMFATKRVHAFVRPYLSSVVVIHKARRCGARPKQRKQPLQRLVISNSKPLNTTTKASDFLRTSCSLNNQAPKLKLTMTLERRTKDTTDTSAPCSAKARK